MKRVYHPTGNAWQDVADDAVKDWTDAGWKASKPKHVDDSEAPEPGGFFVADIARDVQPVEALKAEAAKADKV